MAVFNNKSANVLFNPNTLNIVNVGTTITGDLNSDGDMRLDGNVKGYISSKARLVLGPTSKVDGDIKAANLEVSGEVNGNIYVSELLTVKATAKINGDIHSNKLIIEAGAEFNGKCSMKDSKNMIKPTINSNQSPAKNMKPPPKKYNDFLKYTGIGMQMIVTIVLGTFGGKYLDQQTHLSFPVFTLVGVLVSVFGAVYMAIREFLKK